MPFSLDKLFIEWRRIVPNGVPNPKNDYHLVLLKEICFAKGIDKDIIDILVSAEKMGIETLDTAISYGDSIERLGSIGIQKFKIITNSFLNFR